VTTTEPDQTPAVPNETFREMIAAAMLAPSSHNTQPWIFHPTPTGVELEVDHGRALPINDPDGRELIISCGTAVFNLEVAARHFGFSPYVTPYPDRRRPDVVADVALTAGAGSDELDLYHAITERHTTRGSVTSEGLTTDLRDRFGAVATLHQIEFDVVRQSHREEVAQLVADGDNWQFASPSWRRELAAWMRARRHGDGISVPQLTGWAVRSVVANSDLGLSTAKRDRHLVEAAPMIAVVATERDDERAWLEAGRALEHILLIAAREGLQVGFLNQPCQVPFLRDRLRELLGNRGIPQVMIRVGHPVERARPSARRDVEDVID
jgi:nitroreductase